MPKVPNEELKKEGVKAEVAPRSKSSMFRTFKDRTHKTFVAFTLAAALAACSPATVNAKDTTPAKGGKPVAAALEKKGVTYETIADMNELQPYLDNAKDKTLNLKPGETNKFGPYEFWAGNTIRNITEFKVAVGDEPGSTYSIKVRGPPENTNVLTLDMGDNHPYIKGKMLVFANNEEIWFVYFNNQKDKYERIVVPLEDGGMRSGPVQIGYGKDSGGFFVITAPQSIRAGDVINQAAALNDGSFGPAWFKFEPKEPSQVAMLK